MSKLTRLEDAKRILESAHKHHIVIRALGGIGIGLSCQQDSKQAFARTYNDLDFMGRREQAHEITRMFEELGYTPNKTFNGLHGRERLLFHEPNGGGHIDIFLDSFRMCHSFVMRDRLGICEETLSPSDLFLTKIQIVEINEKDFKDLICLLASRDIGSKDDVQTINIDYISQMCARDWGLYETITVNLGKALDYLTQMALPDDEKSMVSSKVQKMITVIDQEPKTLAWKVRARVGTKKRWYDLPEERDRKVSSQ
jgi:hypothetical protein